MGFRAQFLLEKIRRDGALPGSQFAAKIARAGAGAATAQLYLRACDSVGALVRTQGRPVIENSGRIGIGGGTVLVSSPVPLELRSGRHGRIEIGGACLVNFGVLIAAEDRVSIGDGVAIGPYTVISDTDGSPDMPQPIEIGEGAWLGAHVTVLPGARIGKGAVIGAGSVVEGDIPDRAIAIGVPARPRRRRGERPQTRLPPGPGERST